MCGITLHINVQGSFWFSDSNFQSYISLNKHVRGPVYFSELQKTSTPKKIKSIIAETSLTLLPNTYS